MIADWRVVVEILDFVPGLPQGALVRGGGEGDFDRDRQSGQAILAHIVVRTGLDHRYRRFVFQHTGDQHDRHLGVSLSDQPDRRQAIDVRQIVIGNDQIGMERIQCRHEFGMRGDPARQEGYAGIAQRALFEFRILRDVLEDQQSYSVSDGLCHDQHPFGGRLTTSQYSPSFATVSENASKLTGLLMKLLMPSDSFRRCRGPPSRT